MIPLYQNIKKRRQELEMSQQELADLVGYTSKTMISKIENGEVDLQQSKILAFAEALKTTPSELMGEVKSSTYAPSPFIDDQFPVDFPTQKTFKEQNKSSKSSGHCMSKPPVLGGIPMTVTGSTMSGTSNASGGCSSNGSNGCVGSCSGASKYPSEKTPEAPAQSESNKLAPEEKDELIKQLAKLDVSQLQKVRNYINKLIDLKQ